MLSAPESNVSFTDEQNYQLAEWESRLGNIQGEVRNAENQLAAVNSSVESAQKHAEYLEEQNRHRAPEVDKLITQKKELVADITELTGSLNSMCVSFEAQNAELASKWEALSARERTVSSEELRGESQNSCKLYANY